MKRAILTVVAMVVWVSTAWGEGQAKGPATREITIPKTAVSFKMVRLPDGVIEMPAVGENGVAKKVEVKGLWMGQTELTWEAYDLFALGMDFEDARDWNAAINLLRVRKVMACCSTVEAWIGRRIGVAVDHGG